MDTARSTHVIVGVIPGQPDAVVLEAVVFATHFGGELVCASVDVGRHAVSEHPDGSVESVPYDPDLPELGNAEFDPALGAHLATVLAGRGIRWSTRALAGDPAEALGQLANTLDAAMIVVGTRDPGLRGTLHEIFEGSVAARLAHRQHRPVVVIPINPVPFEETLPRASV